MASLYPDVTVTVETKTKAVWGVCKRFGYGIDAEGLEVPGAYDDQAAMLQFYQDRLEAILRRFYQLAMADDAAAALPDPDSYDMGN